jgi:hypothetical protein
MLLNSRVTEKSYPGLTCYRLNASRKTRRILLCRRASTGAAWPSSARGVNRNLKWHNERNPYPVLQVSQGDCRYNRRKVGMTSGLHGPYAWGCKHGTMAGTKGSNGVSRSKSLKAWPSSD